ncbi:hypothetical protein HMI56_002423, partial [Coelomomyces lativittatus]
MYTPNVPSFEEAAQIIFSPRPASFDMKLPDGVPVAPYERAWPSTPPSRTSRVRKSMLLISQSVLQRAQGVEFCFHTVYDGTTSVLETEFFHPTPSPPSSTNHVHHPLSSSSASHGRKKNGPSLSLSVASSKRKRRWSDQDPRVVTKK